MVLLAIVISLELCVVDVSNPIYCRGVAWLRLVKIWASLRFDDTLGIRPELMRLSSAHLEAQLERTKASGPGRRIRGLPFFVSVRTAISGVAWLAVGFELWQGVSLNLVRNYFLPFPAEDLQGAVQKPTDGAAASSIGRALLLDLKAVVFADGVWC